MNKDFKNFIFGDNDIFFYNEELIYITSKEIINSKPGFNDMVKVHPEVDSSKLSEEEYDKLLEEQFNHDCTQTMTLNIYKKIAEIHPDVKNEFDFYYKKIKNIMLCFPKELYLNIIEWINDENISEILYKDITLIELLEAIEYNNSSNYMKVRKILNIFSYISRYQNGQFICKNQILQAASSQRGFA